MRVGFLFWPFTPNLVRELAADAERYGYDLIGIADTPGTRWTPGCRDDGGASYAKCQDRALCLEPHFAAPSGIRRRDRLARPACAR